MLPHKVFTVYGNVCVNYENKHFAKTLLKSYSVEIDFVPNLLLFGD